MTESHTLSFSPPLTHLQEAVYRLMVTRGAMTDIQMREYYSADDSLPPQSPSGLRSRRAELVARGLVMAADKISSPSDSGKSRTVWEIAPVQITDSFTALEEARKQIEILARDIQSKEKLISRMEQAEVRMRSQLIRLETEALQERAITYQLRRIVDNVARKLVWVNASRSYEDPETGRMVFPDGTSAENKARMALVRELRHLISRVPATFPDSRFPSFITLDPLAEESSHD